MHGIRKYTQYISSGQGGVNFEEAKQTNKTYTNFVVQMCKKLKMTSKYLKDRNSVKK